MDPRARVKSKYKTGMTSMEIGLDVFRLRFGAAGT